jgi:hypothetical protein
MVKLTNGRKPLPSKQESKEAIAKLVPMSAIGRESFAQEMASMADGEAGAGLQDAITAALQAREDVARGEVFIREQLVGLYGDKLKDWPVPDSESTEAKPINNPDKYTTTATGAKGTTISVGGSWYKNYATDLALGKEYVAIIKGAQAWLKGEGKLPETYTLAGVVHKYSADKYKLAALIQRIDERITRMTNSIKRAVAFHFQWLLIEEELPNVAVSYVVEEDEDGEEVIVSTTKPILIRNADIVKFPGEFSQVSVTTFNGYDVNEAVLKGGTYTNLIQTSKGSGDGETPTVERLVKNDATFFSACSDIIFMLEDVANMARIRRQLNQPGDEAVTKKATICTLYEILTPIYQEHIEEMNAKKTKVA